MDNEAIYATTVAFYPVATVLYFLLLYVSAKMTEMSLSKWSPDFVALSFDHKRNTVAYVLNTFWTTVTLILQLCASPILAERYSIKTVDIVKLAGLIVSGLYIFELIYRSSIRLPILIHHFCTLFATILIVCTLEKTQHPALATLGLLWIFHATTEQSIFIGLIMYRLRYSKSAVQRVLYFAAVQSLVFKFAFSVYLYVWWGLKLAGDHSLAMDVAFSVLFILTLSCLMVTQVYGSWAAWSIARAMSSEKKPYSFPPVSRKVGQYAPIDDQGAREGRNLDARWALMKTETYDEARSRENWEAVVCAIKALDIDSWTRNLAAIKALNSQRWHEWSDVRAAAAQGSTDSEDAKWLIACNPQYIQDAYAILEEEKLKLGEHPVSLIFDHPFITTRFGSSLCSRLGIAGEARRIILWTKNSDGEPIFRDIGGVWEDEKEEEEGRMYYRSGPIEEKAGIVPIVTESAFANTYTVQSTALA